MEKILRKIGAKIYKVLFRAYEIEKYQKIRKKYEIEADFKFNGKDIELYGNGKIIIGKNSYIGSKSSICSIEGCIVKIGNNVSISHNVRIYTCNRISEDIIRNEKKIRIKKGDVIIGNNVVIGVNSFIKEGVCIGDNVVIGANTVVNKDIPSNCIVGGVPVKILK